MLSDRQTDEALGAEGTGNRFKGKIKGIERTLLLEVIEVKLYAIQNSVYLEKTLD